MDEIEVMYQIEDGYAGGSRPQYFQVNTADFQGLNAEEIKEALYDEAHEHMLQIVNAVVESADEVAEEILEALAKAEGK